MYKILEWHLIFQKKELLFKKFISMRRVDTSNETSTGIGLYLYDKIVQKFKGTIDAFSEGNDKGAIFTVKFKILE